MEYKNNNNQLKLENYNLNTKYKNLSSTYKDLKVKSDELKLQNSSLQKDNKDLHSGIIFSGDKNNQKAYDIVISILSMVGLSKIPKRKR